jgi:hypothetical protein
MPTSFIGLVSLDPGGLSKALRSILFRLVRPLRDSRKTPVFARPLLCGSPFELAAIRIDVALQDHATAWLPRP